MAIKLRYEEGCKPQSEGVGNKYLLFCFKDTVLKKGKSGEIDTWVSAYGWHFRINPLNTTYVKYDFTVNKTLFIWWNDRYDRVMIKAEPVINQDVTVKAWTVVCEIEGINESILVS